MPTFANYALQASREYLVSIASGGGQPNLNAAKLRDHVLPCPPMETQQRITDYLDAETAEIDALNVVAWPEQMYLIPAWAEMFRAHGLRFHVDPYSSIAYYPYEYSEAERRFLEPWIWENRRAGLDVLRPDAPATVMCSGGVDHINVQPDGSAWRCILERQIGLNPLGDVSDPGFELLQSPLSCAESWQCPACDRDKVTIITN